MKVRSIITLALLAGCNYDYNLLANNEETPASPINEPGAPVAAPGGWDLLKVLTQEPEGSQDEEAIDEGGGDTGAVDTGSGGEGGTLEDPPADDSDSPVDSGLDEEPPLPEDPPEEPPADTDVVPEDPPPPEEPPIEPPPPEPACVYELPQEWTLRTSAGGRESMNSYVGDLDGDGWEDAAWVNQLDQNMTVKWGSSSGLGATPSTYAVGRSEGYIGWGDFNGDLIGDLVVSNQDSRRIVVYRGGVGRTYTEHVKITVADFPQRVLFQDVNRDGLLDILVGQGWAGKTVLLPGTGVGSWGAPADFLPSSAPLASGDFDGDGVEELLQSWNMKLWTIDGAPWTQPVLPHLPPEVATHKAWPVDFDGDGDPDVVAHVGDQLHAWENRSGELLHCPVTSTVPLVPGGINPSAVGDLDGDGVLDWTSQQTCGYCASTYFEVYGE
jgi:hypothetical protein